MRSDIPFDTVRSFFHLPINEASRLLGVCPTILKKICRSNGVVRWPHRKFKCMDRMIEEAASRLPDPRAAEELHELRMKRNDLFVNPAASVRARAEWARRTASKTKRAHETVMGVSPEITVVSDSPFLPVRMPANPETLGLDALADAATTQFGAPQAAPQ
eukprot:m51a1_g3432 hypothetical protein (160) ;mRNA; r:628035-628665